MENQASSNRYNPSGRVNRKGLAPKSEERKTKKCLLCGLTLPAYKFGHHSYSTDGLQSYCGDCQRKFSALDKKYKKEGKGGAKMCKCCHGIKPRTDFPDDPSYKDGKSRICKECQGEPREAKQPKQAQPSLFDNVKALDAYSVQELVDELKRRGYTGTLERKQSITV